MIFESSVNAGQVVARDRGMDHENSEVGEVYVIADLSVGAYE